ncbi:hypothetical protein [Bacillus sp. SD088]|uniref:hypothetical protein n=1 Tax=Bacillus sp. SD088 TaxID=2782012 RepID=UPI0037C03019
MTLWTIFQSPLMYGGTLPDIDEFTLSLFTNRDVLYMYQTLTDRRQYYRDDSWIVWHARNDQNEYFAFFNVSEEESEVPKEIWSKLLKPEETVKDLWRQQELTMPNQKVASHGALLVRKQV